MLTLSVPRAALDRLMPEGARLHGATFAAADPVGALMSSHIMALANVLTDMSTDQSRVAAEATIGLLASCLLPQVAEIDESRPDARLSPMLRARALAMIERRLLDPELGVESLCKSLRLSRTSLYELFADRGGWRTRFAANGLTRRIGGWRIRCECGSESERLPTPVVFRASRHSIELSRIALAALRRRLATRAQAQDGRRPTTRLRPWPHDMKRPCAT